MNNQSFSTNIISNIATTNEIHFWKARWKFDFWSALYKSVKISLIFLREFCRAHLLWFISGSTLHITSSNGYSRWKYAVKMIWMIPGGISCIRLDRQTTTKTTFTVLSRFCQNFVAIHRNRIAKIPTIFLCIGLNGNNLMILMIFSVSFFEIFFVWN